MSTETERCDARCGTCFLSCSVESDVSANDPMCSLCQLRETQPGGVGWLPYVLLIAAVVMWGSSFALTKVAIRDLSPLFVGATRCVIGALTLIVLCLATMRRTGKTTEYRFVPTLHPAGWRALGWVIVGGLAIVSAFMLVAFGVKTVDSGSAGVVLSTVPIWTIVMARAVGTRSGSSWWSLTIAVILGSAAVVVLAMPVHTSISVVGVAFLVGAALAHALSNVSASGALQSFRPLAASALLVSAAAVAGSILGLTSLPTGSVHWSVIAAVIALGVLPSGLSYVCFFSAVAALGPVRASLANYLLPPVSVLIGVALMGEPLTMATIGALLLAVAALTAGSGRFDRRRTRPVPAAQPDAA